MVQQLTAPSTTEQSPDEPQTGKGLEYEEFRAAYPDDVRAEWVEGEVILLMPPDEVHQDIVVFLTSILNFFVRAFDLGKVLTAPFEMKLGGGKSYREPDLLFVSKQHLDRLDGKRLVGPADLVVEVVSDESVARDRRDKFAEYAANGIQEYWLIDPRDSKKTVIVWSLTPEGYYQQVEPNDQGIYESAVVNGFRFDQAWFTEDALPNPEEALNLISPQRFRKD